MAALQSKPTFSADPGATPRSRPQLSLVPPPGASSTPASPEQISRSALKRDVLKNLRELAVSYSSILFQDNPVLGCGLLLATFLQSDVGFCGILGLLTSWVILKILKVQTAAFRCFVFYNSLLTGLFMGYVFQLDWMVALMTIVAVALCVMLTAVADSILHFYELPVLSLPFTLTALLLSLARPQLTNLGDASPYHISQNLPVPESINLALKALGSLFCNPSPVFGAVMMGLLLVASPLTAAFFAGGLFLGHELESFLRLGQPEAQMMHQFNYSLTFTAVSLVFLPPSRRSISLGLITILLTSVVSLGSATFWSVFRIPIVPFAFNATVLIILRAARWILPAQIRSAYTGSPEATLDLGRLFRVRSRSGEIGILCPFADAWVVQQAFDGPWTHKGLWKHALDFVQHGTDGKTFKNQGFDLGDYYCFGQKILSPVEGTVVATCGDQADNPIGAVDNQKNWGNYLIIRSYAGYFVLLAHLKKDSLLVRTGDLVSAGKPIAQCGNSGYSQEPHLHLQVQWTALPGGYTVPFHLMNYGQPKGTETEFVFRGLPETNAVVVPFVSHVFLERALNFRIDQVLKFRMNQNKEVQIRVELDENAGALRLRDDSSQIYFGRLGAQFYFYGFSGQSDSPLADLYRAAPRIPLVVGERGYFQDTLPIRLLDLPGGVAGRALASLKELFGFNSSELLSKQFKHYQIEPKSLEVTGEDTHLKLDPLQGIMYFKSKRREYEIVE